MPFCVTEAARDELIEMLERIDAPEHRAARFVVKGNHVRLTIDRRRSGDVRVDHAGRTVLVLDEEVAEQLGGHLLDKARPGTGRLQRKGLTLAPQGAPPS